MGNAVQAGKTCTATGFSCDIGGLTNGKTYTFQITAHNDQGTGAPATTTLALPRAVTTTAFTKVSGTFKVGKTVTVAVRVAPTAGLLVAGVPNGKVTVKIGTKSFCTVTLSNGAGSCKVKLTKAHKTVTAKTAGRKLVATYTGAVSFAPSTKTKSISAIK